MAPACTAQSWNTATERMVRAVFFLLSEFDWLSPKLIVCPPSVAVTHIAWYSEDEPFAVGYADGKLLIGSKEPFGKGAIVVIDAHKVKSCHTK